MIKAGDRFNIKDEEDIPDFWVGGPYLCDDVTENYHGSGMTMVHYTRYYECGGSVSSLRILSDCEKIEESKCEI